MDMSGGRRRAGIYDAVIAFQAHSTLVISTNAVLGIDDAVVMCVQSSGVQSSGKHNQRRRVLDW
jgi:predicted tellurium resistance membrane protein TerC